MSTDEWKYNNTIKNCSTTERIQNIVKIRCARVHEHSQRDQKRQGNYGYK